MEVTYTEGQNVGTEAPTTSVKTYFANSFEGAKAPIASVKSRYKDADGAYAPSNIYRLALY